MLDPEIRVVVEHAAEVSDGYEITFLVGAHLHVEIFGTADYLRSLLDDAKRKLGEVVRREQLMKQED